MSIYNYIRLYKIYETPIKRKMEKIHLWKIIYLKMNLFIETHSLHYTMHILPQYIMY